MDQISTFLLTFTLVFINEFGDKTQFAAGTGALANRTRIGIIFSSSALALIAVAGLTVLFAGLIPRQWVPTIEIVGASLLIGYGLYLLLTAGTEEGVPKEETTVRGLSLFVAHFFIVFIAELGDKTQVMTFGLAMKNQHSLTVVFVASATALVTVTALTVWGATKIPRRWKKVTQQFGAVAMIIYGVHMFSS